MTEEQRTRGHLGTVFCHVSVSFLPLGFGCLVTDRSSIRLCGEQTDRSSINWVIWTLVFSAAIVASGYFILQVYSQWTESPIIVTFDAKGLTVDQIDFPSVTICNCNKGSGRRLTQVANDPRLLKANITAKDLRSIIRLMTRIDAAYKNDEELIPVRDKLIFARLNVSDIQEIIIQTVYSCEEMLIYCIWKGKREDCSKLFFLEPVDDGFCCVFNSVVYNERRFDTISNSSQFTKSEVRRSQSYGLNMGLSVIVDTDIIDYALTTSRYNGFKVLVGHPEEFPDPGKRGFVVGPGMEAYVAITPDRMSTDERVEPAGVSFEKIQCRFGSFKTKWLPTYTAASCLLECEIEALLKRCGCRPYYYPVDSSLPSCNLWSYPCLANVTMMIRRNEITCDCADACDNVNYRVELSYATFPGYGFYHGGLLDELKKIANDSLIQKKLSNDSYTRENLSRLHFFYKDGYVVHYVRDLRLAWEDFIASLGGLLGLGTGFSLLSGMEIIYFFTVRWHTRRMQTVRKRKPINDDASKIEANGWM